MWRHIFAIGPAILLLSIAFGLIGGSQCLTSTTDRTAPGSLAMNVVLGSRYMGSSDRCPACRSVIRTLWLWLVLPVFPLGSYRVITTDTYSFIGRRTKLNWSQVVTVYAVAAAVVAVVAFICWNNYT